MRQLSDFFKKEAPRLIEKQVSDAMTKHLSVQRQESAPGQNGHAAANSGSATGEAPPPAAAANDGDIPHGLRVRLDSLQRQIESQKAANSALEKQIRDKETALRIEKRRNVVMNAGKSLNAHNPEQLYQLIKDSVIEDTELGDVVEVKTASGKDLVPLPEYLANHFAADNPHLFQKPDARSGSGAGIGGAAPGSAKRIDVADLKDPSQGGMGWKKYEAEREQIHERMERQAGIKAAD